MSGMMKIANRRYFIGGSDARIIMGDDEAALLQLWREKRPVDLSARGCHGGAEPPLVRGQYRSGPHRRAETHSASRAPLDGSNP
jgi:hypothetical protein